MSLVITIAVLLVVGYAVGAYHAKATAKLPQNPYRK